MSRRVKHSIGSQIEDICRGITVDSCDAGHREVRCRFLRGGQFVLRGGPAQRRIRIVSSPGVGKLSDKDKQALVRVASRALRAALKQPPPHDAPQLTLFVR